MSDRMNRILKEAGCPYYEERKKGWRVRFQERHDEEGDLLFVASEFINSGLVYRFNTKQTRGKDYSGHAHSFESVLHAVLEDPEDFRLPDLNPTDPCRK